MPQINFNWFPPTCLSPVNPTQISATVCCGCCTGQTCNPPTLLGTTYNPIDAGTLSGPTTSFSGSCVNYVYTFTPTNPDYTGITVCATVSCTGGTVGSTGCPPYILSGTYCVSVPYCIS